MLNQLKYFLEIVDAGSFSEAAERQHISQSAISQQMKALEANLGVKLFERNGRKFLITTAGDYFYRKSRLLLEEYEKIRKETIRIGGKKDAEIKIGYLCGYSEWEMEETIAEFSERFPHVFVQLTGGSHDELYNGLRTGQLDLVFSDKRRIFSDAYVNLILTKSNSYVELAVSNPLSRAEQITVEKLKNTPCILIASHAQRETESIYYREYIGFQGDFIYAENREEARLLVLGNKGFLLAERSNADDKYAKLIRRVPLYIGGKLVSQTFCLFWKKGNSGYYVEEFADILKSKFSGDTDNGE